MQLPILTVHWTSTQRKVATERSEVAGQHRWSLTLPTSAQVAINARKEAADRAFYAAPMLRHVEVAAGMKHIGFAALQSCQQLQIVKLPLSLVSLEDGVFQGCCVLKEVAACGACSSAVEFLPSAARFSE